MKEPFISIHILNYNGKKFLKGCIDSLLKQNYSNFEIVLVDNHSTDDSVSYIKKLYENEIKENKVRLLLFEKNHGIAGGYNRSYEQTKADYVLLLNDDIIIPQPYFLKQLLDVSKKEKAPLTSGWTHPFNETEAEKEMIKKMINPTLTILGYAIGDVINENISLIAGVCCLLVDKSKVKGPLFPEEYFCYGEDVFLGWKSLLEDTKNIFYRDAAYIHYGSGTIGKGTYFTRYNSEKNRIANLLIFFEIKTLIKLFPLFLFENFVRSIYYIKSPKLFLGFFSAVFWNIKNYKIIKKYRREIQKNRKFDDEKIISLMSYKLFPEHISRFSKALNNISKSYLKLLNMRTYDLFLQTATNPKASSNS